MAEVTKKQAYKEALRALPSKAVSLCPETKKKKNNRHAQRLHKENTICLLALCIPFLLGLSIAPAKFGKPIALQNAWQATGARTCPEMQA